MTEKEMEALAEEIKDIAKNYGADENIVASIMGKTLYVLANVDNVTVHNNTESAFNTIFERCKAKSKHLHLWYIKDKWQLAVE